MRLSKTQSAKLRKHLLRGDYVDVATALGKYTSRYVRDVAFGERSNDEIVNALLAKAEENKRKKNGRAERLEALAD